MTRPRKSLPRTVRAAVLHPGATCVYCHAAAAPGRPLVVDHIHPHSKGGSDDISNLQALCEPCNQGKSDAVPGKGSQRVPHFALHHFPNGVRA